jgi:RNA polymerase sigma-70 factor (ECF subfamily)
VDTTSDAAFDAQVDDRELVAAAQAGDSAAMTELLTRHYGYVYGLCRRILDNPHDAEDARQEALISATRYIATFNGQSAFRTWLHAITRNVCLNMLRARKKQPKHSIDDVFNDDNDPPNRPGSVADEHAVDQRMQIDSALAALPENIREVVVLRFIFDMDYAQIADELGMPLGTVKTWLRRGRMQLMSMLGESFEGGGGV